MKSRYQNYLKNIQEMTKSGILKNNFIPKSFADWHKEDYKDRVEEYYITEYCGTLFCEKCWNANRTEEEGDEIYNKISDIIDACYKKKLPITVPARFLSCFFKALSS